MRAYGGWSSAKAGAAPTSELPRVWGVIVDWAVGDGIATFVALVDGTSSMYTSSGGGIIGGQGSEPVRAANRRLLLAAEAAYEHLTPVAAAGPPEPARVVYWVRAYDGLRVTSHPASGPGGEPWLSALGEAFQDFVSALRLADEHRAGQG
jgi:hypothetical protein